MASFPVWEGDFFVCLFVCFAFPSYISGVHHFEVRFLHMWPFFNPTIRVVSHIPSSWMVQAGCVFVADIHPSRTWTSGSFESVRWNACVHRLDLGLYSHPKEFLGNGVWTHVNSKGKIPSTGKFPQRRIEPASLWTAREGDLFLFILFSWLCNTPTTCQCISGRDLLTQWRMLPHYDRRCRSNLLSHPVREYWHQANSFKHWTYSTRHLSE